MEKVTVFLVGGIEEDRLIAYWSNIPQREQKNFLDHWKKLTSVVARADEERNQPWTYESSLDFLIGIGESSRWVTFEGPMVDFRKVPHSDAPVNLFAFFHNAVFPNAFDEAVIYEAANQAERAISKNGFLQRFWWFQKKLFWVTRSCNSSEDYEFITCKVEQYALESNNEYIEFLDKLKRLRLIGTGTKRAGRPPIQDDIAALVLARDGEKCVHCGATDNLEFDHILPFSRGGSSSEDNLQILCRRCNAKRGALK